MVFGLRYHVFTITAIFVALGLGILIGTSIIGNDHLVEEQNKMISNIGENIIKLKTENSQLTGDIKQLKLQIDDKEKMERKLLSLLVKEKIAGESFLLYIGKNKNIEYEIVEEIFAEAGVELKSIRETENITGQNEGSKLILWNIAEEKLNIETAEKAIICTKNTAADLIITILENYKNEEGKKKYFSNYSSL